MRRKLRIELRIGLLLFALNAVLNQFTKTPHFILGVVIGISLCLMLKGSLRETPYNAVKSIKKKIMRGR
jgi:uncharacterized membrane protein YhaH (DUF805 family)